MPSDRGGLLVEPKSRWRAWLSQIKFRVNAEPVPPFRGLLASMLADREDREPVSNSLGEGAELEPEIFGEHPPLSSEDLRGADHGSK